MAIRQQIEAIISNRQQCQPEFLRMFDEVIKMREFINGVNSFKSNPGWLTMIESNEKLKIEWNTLVADVNKLDDLVKSLCDGDTGSLVECIKRVKRDFLNIGCVGPWRQGKSTVISKLTNLSDYVIPRSKFLTCTGTTINIFNGNQVIWENGQYTERNGNKAVVYYHSYDSICKTINDYLKELKLGSMPYASSRESFISNCKKCYQANVGKPGTDSKLKKMLDTYLCNAEDYVDLLKSQDNMFDEITSLSSIESQRRLRPLVSYYEHTDAEYLEMGVQTPPQVFKVLAVKKVDVFTTFLVNGTNGPEEVGKIQFVDTPGLGESKLEVAETLAKSLRSELDIAICLRKVSNQAGIIPTDSFDFHKVLKQNTYGRKPENWVFYLYNKEGDVSEEILQTTFTEINNNLALVNEESLISGQTVGGIKLAYDKSNSNQNHIDFIDAENDIDKLQLFFVSILTEMASTIADSDKAFYKEARETYGLASELYHTLTKNSFRSVSQCLPTFDDREKILKTIKAVNAMWMNNVKCPDTINENIVKALGEFYKEPYGVVLAEILGMEPAAIKKMKEEILKVENASEMTGSQRLEKRRKIAYDALFPYIEKKVTSYAVNVKAIPAIYYEISENLSNCMSKRAIKLVESTNAIQQLDDVKLIFWRGLMIDGMLSFGKTDEKLWLDYFLNLLKEGGSDFSALRTTIENFKNYTFNLNDAITQFVRAIINNVTEKYGILHGSGDSIETIRKSLYECLISCESETKAAIQSQCKQAVEGQLLFALTNFNDQVKDFGMRIIPVRKHILDYEVEFEQLVKFYNKYSAEIFTADEQANQKLAVQEWSVLKLKYLN